MAKQNDTYAPKPQGKGKKKRSPLPALIVCAVVIYTVGFLAGFLCGVVGRDTVVSMVLSQFQSMVQQVTPQTDPPETDPPQTTADAAEEEPLPDITQPPEPTEPQTPALECPIALDDWRLTLVNPWNQVPDGYADTIRLADTINSQQVDERILGDLNEMIDDMYIAGLNPAICSGYRSMDTQRKLYDKKVSALMSTGMTEEAAMAEAATVVAVPGTSEHHLGLAIDVVDNRDWTLDESQENTDVQKWMMEHSWEYGFILRYPNGKSDITGIIYEPWHYRYVGREVAAQIYELGVTFEEYLELIGK